MRPNWLVWVHHIHASLLGLLLFSGLFLYFPQTRTQFNEWQIPLVTVHIWLVFAYIPLVLVAVYRALQYAFRRQPVKKFNVVFNLGLFGLWSLSGGVMYFQAHFPIEVRNLAVVIHDTATWVAIPWLLTHSIGHLVNYQMPWPRWWKANAKPPAWVAEYRLERRTFLKSLGVFVMFVAIGGWIRWLSPLLSLPNPNERRGYFRIYNVTSDYPKYGQDDWKLTIDGFGDQSVTATMNDLLRIKRHTIADDFNCVTGWSVRGVEMDGILIKDLFAYYQIEAKDPYIKAYSGDRIYYDTFTTEQLLDEGAMLVFSFDGEPLKAVQGFPCRLYHPDMFGYKSVKWLTRLELTSSRDKGYWQEKEGYDLNGYL